MFQGQRLNGTTQHRGGNRTSELEIPGLNATVIGEYQSMTYSETNDGEFNHFQFRILCRKNDKNYMYYRPPALYIDTRLP